jgi:L-rhamnose-H+ transport protein
VTFVAIPRLWEVYSDFGVQLVMTVAGFGIGWGLSQLLFGLAVDALGMALAFSIVASMSAALGSLVPLLGLHPGEFLSWHGFSTIFGIALIALGMAACAVAGERRDTGRRAEGNRRGFGYRRGLVFAAASGLGSAMVNFALAFGAPLLEAARRYGADPVWAPITVWLPLMLAGAIPNLTYCGFLMWRSRTAAHFIGVRSGANWLCAIAMAVLWFGSIYLYGLASSKLGSWGPILGWPLFTSLIILTAGGIGFAAGEWKHASVGSLRLQASGMMLVVFAVFVLSIAAQRM